MRAYLIGHLNKFVGGLPHRENDRHDTMTTAMQIGETARNRADFCGCFKTGAAVFLHDDGIKLAPSHGTPPSALLAQCLNYSNIKPSSERQLAQIGSENCGANSLSQLGGDHAGHK